MRTTSAMPAAMPPVRIIDHICSLASASRAASISAAAWSAAVVSNGIEATVMSSPRAASRPTAVVMRSRICCWLRLPATASSMTTETVSRLSPPGAPWVTSVVLPTALLAVVDSFSYDDYLETLPNPVFISTFPLEPLAGKGLLAYPLDMVMATVDHMLGGSGRAGQPNRPMTAMETAITTHLLSRLLDEFATSFGAITEVQPALDGFEYNPQLAQAAAGSDTVMVATFAMAVGSREGEATLVLPFSAFAQALNNAASPQLSETALAKRKRAAEALTARLNLVPVDVSVRFAPLTVSSADLLSLAVGDVLLLRHPPDAPLEVTTNDVTFAYAIASNHRRRLAAAIVPTPYAAAKDTA